MKELINAAIPESIKVSTKEAASILGKSTSTVKRNLKGKRVNRRGDMVFSLRDVANYKEYKTGIINEILQNENFLKSR